MSHIVMGVSGSIAAYKACDVVRLLRKQTHDVSVVMTEAATAFVGTLTFQTLSGREVYSEMFMPAQNVSPSHISLADRADVFVVAPCTANVMAKVAHGLADDLLSCSLLATQAPVVIAPAMNCHMWDHAATQHNLTLLRQRGVCIVEPIEGELACGYEGRGRMANPVDVVDAIVSML